MSRKIITIVFGTIITAIPTLSYAQSTTTGGTGLPLPRFASLKSNKVNVRVGPGTDFKIEWLYQKRGLPMEIILEFDNWRKVRDPEGNEGWVLHSLLSGKRTAVVRPWEADKSKLSNLRKESENSASVTARLEPGVVAEVKSCSEDWCNLQLKDAEGKEVEGYIEKNSIWGVYPDEFIED